VIVVVVCLLNVLINWYLCENCRYSVTSDIYCGGGTCGIYVSLVGVWSCRVSFVPRLLQHYDQRGRKLSVDISLHHVM